MRSVQKGLSTKPPSLAQAERRARGSPRPVNHTGKDMRVVRTDAREHPCKDLVGHNDQSGAAARRLQAVHVTLDVELANGLAVLSERNLGS